MDLLLIPANIPTLLSLRDIIKNDLDISIQEKVITNCGRKQKSQMKNLFLIHYWDPIDMPYALQTEEELRTIYKTFGNTSIAGTGNIMKGASNGVTEKEMKGLIRFIANE